MQTHADHLRNTNHRWLCIIICTFACSKIIVPQATAEHQNSNVILYLLHQSVGLQSAFTFQAFLQVKVKVAISDGIRIVFIHLEVSS